jgi:hypothetical protein
VSKKKAGDAQRHVILRKLSPFFFGGAAAKEEHICFANENGV